MSIEKIRNFCIVAHIDHGKSTLADRILVLTKTVAGRDIKAQHLDSNSLERERGITIKAKAVAMDWKGYRLNLIDTPGHVDFNYEVSRSLAACEGAVLVVDATQGVEAQTLANVYLAIEQGLEILPVLNKIDLPSADVDRTREQIEQVVGLDCSEAISASGKTGAGVADTLKKTVRKVPSPKGKAGARLRALIFDSWYDSYRGAVVMVRVVDGTLKKGDKVRFLAGGTDHEAIEIGVFTPFATPVEELSVGEVGFFAANIRSVHDVKLGDTLTHATSSPCTGPHHQGPTDAPLPGFKDVKAIVFAS